MSSAPPNTTRPPPPAHNLLFSPKDLRHERPEELNPSLYYPDHINQETQVFPIIQMFLPTLIALLLQAGGGTT